jgi:ABC-type multidrug transport system fused ATPase/permease subunit
MFVRSPKLAFCVVSVIPIVAVVNKKYGDWLRRSATDVQDALAEANAAAIEAISCVKTVLSFSSEELEKDRYSRAIQSLYKVSLRQVRYTSPHRG